ncbi:MAG: serine hydrolase [Bacteroidota bacterium]
MKLLTKSVPAYFLFLIIFIAGGIILYQKFNPVRVYEKIEAKNSCDFQIIRNTKYKFIRPLILGDRNCEDEIFSVLKTNLNEYLNSEKSTGALKSASVYVREFDQGKWFSINPTETFSPGSMMKIATLITYLKDSEHNPDLLNQKIQFKATYSQMPVQSIVSGHLTSGRYYTIKELMEAMIIDSDNDATMLLSQTMNANTYFDLCRSLNLAVPTKDQVDYPITAMECSRFLRVIFNSSYLESANSEYAMNLLTKSKFSDGLIKLLPETISVAHKFGEKFNPIEQQLHETAIVFSSNKPYLITVMTRGTDQQKLKTVLNSISKKVYDFMAAR